MIPVSPLILKNNEEVERVRDFLYFAKENGNLIGQSIPFCRRFIGYGLKININDRVLK